MPKVLRYKPLTPYVPLSPVRISTISALARINVDVDHYELYQHLPLVDKADDAALGVFALKYYDKNPDSRRIHRHYRWGTETADEVEIEEVQKYFQNQLTILWRYQSETGVIKVTNGFIFCTGNVKAVGLKSDEDVARSYEALRLYLDTHRASIGFGSQPLELLNPRATMFNTDCMTGNKLLRTEVFRLVLKEYHLEDSEFEVDIYPAVKVKFAWNSEYLHGPHASDYVPGLCYCQSKCNGKGRGHGDGECKVVTISVFGNDTTHNTKPGKLIITGANTFQQVREVHAFMNAMLETHHERLFYREPYMADVAEGGEGAGGAGEAAGTVGVAEEAGGGGQGTHARIAATPVS